MSNGMKTKALNLARKVIPGGIRHKLSYEAKKTQAKISHTKHRKAFSRKQNGQITIVFLVCEPQSWNSLKSVHEAALNHPNLKVHMVVSPKDIDGKWIIKEKVLDFFKNETMDVIPGYQNGILFDIASLSPDIVFRQTPYDEQYPKEYGIGKIARYAKTCYVPYGYNMSSEKHLKIENNHRFVKDLFAVFTDCRTDYDFCRKLQMDLYPDLHVVYKGFPRIDLLRNLKDRRDKDSYTFTWIPRWSLDSVYNDPSGFFVYKDKLLEFFEKNKHCNLIIRPHPAMFSSFIQWGAMTVQEVEAFIEVINQWPNVRMDDHFDYLLTFEETDALIADWSSLDYEFYLTGKPIIYCGSTEEQAAEVQTMMQLLYKADNWENMEKHMKALISGHDELFEERRKDIQSMYADMPENIGEAIVDQCVMFCS